MPDCDTEGTATMVEHRFVTAGDLRLHIAEEGEGSTTGLPRRMKLCGSRTDSLTDQEE